MADEEDDVDGEAGFDELADSDGTDQEAPSGSGKKKIILFVVLPLLLICGAGAGVYFSGILDEPKAVAETEKEPPPVKLVFYNLPELLTNINGAERGAAVLKAKIVLQLVEGSDLSQLDLLQPRIVDILQVVLRELRIDDLRGSESMAILRRELLARINQAVEPVKVSSVLFQEILIQ